MSNMNGGRFYPHASHRQGVDADGFFKGYYKPSECTVENGAELCHPTAYAASVLMALLRSPYGAPIDKIFVTYRPSHILPVDRFFDELDFENGNPLPDGRRVLDVIRVEKKHDTHFHIRFKR